MNRKLSLLLALAGLMGVIAAACGGGGEATGSPAPSPSQVPPPSSTSQPSKGAFLQFADRNCILDLAGELGELTTITRTYVENEPKQNIERIFQRFHQGATPSTILRCDLRTAGLFATWWVQSFQTEAEAQQLYEAFIEVTAPKVAELNQNLLSCAGIHSRQDDTGMRYTLDFVDKGLCESSVFNGMSGLVLYKRAVIGVDSQFYEELFEIIVSHAQQLVDKGSDQDA